MNTCMAFKTTGERCTRNSVQDIDLPHHLHFCRLHTGTYATRLARNNQVHHQPGKCIIATARGTWCVNDAGDTGRCDYHTRIEDRRAARALAIRQRVARVLQTVHTFETRQPRPPWREVVRDLYGNQGTFAHVPFNERFEIANLYFQRNRMGEDQFATTIVVWRYANWVRGGQIAPEPAVVDLAALAPRPATLGALAQDGQNVHRAVVSEQTNKNTDLLLATPDVPDNLRAHELLAASWLNNRLGSWTAVRRVTDDVYLWRQKEMCRTEGDFLYRRLLHALYMRIHRTQDAETRRELLRRVYEECSEAVGLCCEGHISRLCNVLVGFEDGFKPPVPFGEIVQAKMSAIAEMDGPLEDKVKLAMEFFDEHKVPVEARVAWLDAF